MHPKFAEYAQRESKRFVVMYGQCEATARMSYLPHERALDKVGSMGIAIPGGRFKLIGVDGEEVGKWGSEAESNNQTIEQSNNSPLPNLSTLFSVITEKFQTITYFGIDPRALRAALCTRHCRGIDRIVPIGQAMDVGVIWDGHDLVRTLSRVVNIC